MSYLDKIIGKKDYEQKNLVKYLIVTDDYGEKKRKTHSGLFERQIFREVRDTKKDK